MRKILFTLAFLLVLVSCGPGRGRYVQITGTAQSVGYAVKFNAAKLFIMHLLIIIYALGLNRR